jgi:copper chaperone CopZ
MKHLIKGLFVLTLLLFAFSFQRTEAINTQIVKVENKTYIKIWVDGMACPFCAYGLEKKIKKIESSSDFFVEINEGFISFTVNSDKIPSEEELKIIVKEAGFTARKIEFSNSAFKENEE